MSTSRVTKGHIDCAIAPIVHDTDDLLLRAQNIMLSLLRLRTSSPPYREAALIRSLTTGSLQAAMKLCGGLELDTASLKPGSRAPKDLALHEGRIGERQYEQRPHTCLHSLSHVRKMHPQSGGCRVPAAAHSRMQKTNQSGFKGAILTHFPGIIKQLAGISTSLR